MKAARYYMELIANSQEAYGDRALYLLTPVPEYLDDEYLNNRPEGSAKVLSKAEAQKLDNLRHWTNEKYLAEAFYSCGD